MRRIVLLLALIMAISATAVADLFTPSHTFSHREVPTADNFNENFTELQRILNGNIGTENLKSSIFMISNDAYAATWDADTTHSPSKNAVYDKFEAIDYTTRDDPSDYDQTTLTQDNAYHDLDLSAIVGTGAKYATLYVEYMDTAAGEVMLFRKNGYTNPCARIDTQVANVNISMQVQVQLDTSGICEYKVSSAATSITIAVVGWGY